MMCRCEHQNPPPLLCHSSPARVTPPRLDPSPTQLLPLGVSAKITILDLDTVSLRKKRQRNTVVPTVVDAYDLSERNLTTRPNYYINTVPDNLKYFLLESSKYRYEHNGLPVRNCSAQTTICTRYAVCQFVHSLPSCMRYAVCQIVGSTQPANLYLVRGLPIFTWARGLPI